MVTEPTINSILDHLRERSRQVLPESIGAAGRPFASDLDDLADQLDAVPVDEKTFEPLEDTALEELDSAEGVPPPEDILAEVPEPEPIPQENSRDE